MIIALIRDTETEALKLVLGMSMDKLDELENEAGEMVSLQDFIPDRNLAITIGRCWHVEAIPAGGTFNIGLTPEDFIELRAGKIADMQSPYPDLVIRLICREDDEFFDQLQEYCHDDTVVTVKDNADWYPRQSLN